MKRAAGQATLFPPSAVHLLYCSTIQSPGAAEGVKSGDLPSPAEAGYAKAGAATKAGRQQGAKITKKNLTGLTGVKKDQE